MRIAYVTPWFGENIPGGAEMAMRGIALRLYEAGIDIEILSTCVKEFNSDWNENYHPEGDDSYRGIPIRRFKVRKRNVEEFDKVNYKIMNDISINDEEEKIYVEEMINSPRLYKYIEDNKDYFDLFIFTPYMFGTTYFGASVCPQKSILTPCFHDEGYIYMKIWKKLYSSVRGMIFNSKPEQALAQKVFDLSKVKAYALGEGVDTDFESVPDRFREKYNINYPFIIYAGRKEAGKKVDVLIQYFKQYKKLNDNELKLILIGGGDITILESDKSDIIDLGFVPIQDKYDAYSAADMLCQPSVNESFSLVIMESWLCKRPILVNASCEVTKNFAIDSKGGLYFKDYFEFEGCINYLIKNNEVANAMGKNGCEYVNKNFSWDEIVKKYIEYLTNV